jgi:hypothetical protein
MAASSGSGGLDLGLVKCCPGFIQGVWRQIGKGGPGPSWCGGGGGVVTLPGQDKLSSLMPPLAEWTQRDLERMENIRFCRQYLVFHDGDSVVFAGPAGNSVETRGE